VYNRVTNLRGQINFCDTLVIDLNEVFLLVPLPYALHVELCETSFKSVHLLLAEISKWTKKNHCIAFLLYLYDIIVRVD